MTTKPGHNICIVIPAFNEQSVIKEVIQNIRDYSGDTIIVVNDGSSDDTASRAGEAGVIVLSHKINRGKGAATKTGLEAAKLLDADVIVTMDGDGQHDPKDIANLIEPILDGQCDVTLGTRPLRSQTMPRHKIIANQVGNLVTWSLYGLRVNDSQSGFRAYSRRAADIINTRADQYNYESEIIREIKEYRLKFLEIPITVHYTQYALTKHHRQDFANGLKTVYKMIWDKISF